MKKLEKLFCNNCTQGGSGTVEDPYYTEHEDGTKDYWAPEIKEEGEGEN